MKSKTYRISNQLPSAPENVLRDIYADEAEPKEYHYAFNSAEIKELADRELSKIQKQVKKLRSGQTWYSLSFQRTGPGEFKISVDKRMLTGPCVLSLNIDDRSIYGLISVDDKDIAGSAFYPAGCYRLTPEWHNAGCIESKGRGSTTLVMGGRKLKPLMRKMEYLAKLNASEIARQLDEEYEFYESMYLDWR